MRLEAFDMRQIWCEAIVLDERGSGDTRELYVHYVGWKKRWREWLHVHGGQLRPLSQEALLLPRHRGRPRVRLLLRDTSERAMTPPGRYSPVYAPHGSLAASLAERAPPKLPPPELPPPPELALSARAPPARAPPAHALTTRPDGYDKCGTFGCILADKHNGLHCFPQPVNPRRRSAADAGLQVHAPQPRRPRAAAAQLQHVLPAFADVADAAHVADAADAADAAASAAAADDTIVVDVAQGAVEEPARFGFDSSASSSMLMPRRVSVAQQLAHAASAVAAASAPEDGVVRGRFPAAAAQCEDGMVDDDDEPYDVHMSHLGARLRALAPAAASGRPRLEVPFARPVLPETSPAERVAAADEAEAAGGASTARASCAAGLVGPPRESLLQRHVGPLSDDDEDFDVIEDESSVDDEGEGPPGGEAMLSTGAGAGGGEGSTAYLTLPTACACASDGDSDDDESESDDSFEDGYGDHSEQSTSAEGSSHDDREGSSCAVTAPSQPPPLAVPPSSSQRHPSPPRSETASSIGKRRTLSTNSVAASLPWPLITHRSSRASSPAYSRCESHCSHRDRGGGGEGTPAGRSSHPGGSFRSRAHSRAHSRAGSVTHSVTHSVVQTASRASSPPPSVSRATSHAPTLTDWRRESRELEQQAGRHGLSSSSSVHPSYPAYPLRSRAQQRPPTVKRPTVLITACSYANVAGLVRPLVDVPEEAKAIEAAFPAHATTRLDNPSVDALAAALPGRTSWFFLGHGDAMVRGERMPLFVGDNGRCANGLQAISHEALVATLAAACDHHLTLVVLNGCKTLPLADAILERCTNVQHVICWQSSSHSGAASVFGTALARGLAESGARPRGVQRAFESAKAAVLRVVEHGHLAGGAPVGLPLYVLEDPEDHAKVYASGPLVGRLVTTERAGTKLRQLPPVAAGVPCLRTRAAEVVAA